MKAQRLPFEILTANIAQMMPSDNKKPVNWEKLHKPFLLQVFDGDEDREVEYDELDIHDEDSL